MFCCTTTTTTHAVVVKAHPFSFIRPTPQNTTQLLLNYYSTYISLITPFLRSFVIEQD
jgi:hypothetical protein